MERGKNSGYEKVQRLGEVKTLQDIEKYKFWKIADYVKIKYLCINAI